MCRKVSRSSFVFLSLGNFKNLVNVDPLLDFGVDSDWRGLTRFEAFGFVVISLNVQVERASGGVRFLTVCIWAGVSFLGLEILWLPPETFSAPVSVDHVFSILAFLGEDWRFNIPHAIA